MSRIVERSLAEAQLTDAVSAYKIAPALVQLRRYMDPGREVKLICVIDLALSDHQGTLVATVRGSAATVRASRAETLDAAAHAAVARLPLALRSLRERAPEPVARQ